MAVIEVAAVSRRYGEVRALSEVSLTVAAGQVLGLIGHNGAGKSTLIKLMLGLIAPDEGEVRIGGAQVRGASFREVRRRIAYLPESVVFYDNLSGLETLEFFAALKGADRSSCPGLLDEVGLGHAATRAVKGYSKGMRQRLGFAQALLGAPEILFLDEPTSGLDPEGIREFYSLLARLKSRGVTVVLSSHNLAQIEERIDRLALLQSGRLKASGTVAELRAQLDLPLIIALTLRAAGTEAALVAALAAVPGCEVRRTDPCLEVRCAREHKMAVLEVLARHAGLVADFDLREPSLEEVFLGYTVT